ncbi:MAG: putative multidrug resistance ABC transporter ATP-binding/permease protein YheI [Firmicutes bacterium ADurb.Bin419]|nr:MAG: putative multidrug resistance ABC transporter ATP-binding/permease protein YheI [Firmicutes bacterium ADurb.Bin419]
MNNLRYIKDLIFKYRFKYLVGLISLIIVDALQLFLPMVLGNITNRLKLGTLTRQQLNVFSILLVCIAIGIALFRFVWRYKVYGVSKILEAAIRARFYEHIQKLSVNYFNNHKTGDLMAHATNDINNISVALGQGVALGLDSALIPIAAIIMMFITCGIKLTFFSLIPLVILGGIMWLFVVLMEKRVQKMQESFSLITENARENFSGIRVVKAFTQEQKEIIKFEKSNMINRQMNLKFVRLMSLMFPLVMTVSAFSFAIALWLGGMEVIKGEITLGDFVAFNSFLGMLIWPIAALGWTMNMFQRGIVSLKRINTIMDEKPEIIDNSKTIDIDQIKGKIEFRNLSFTYPGSQKPVLKNINITLENGKTLAIVGPTGCGKTTLINLIQRLYEVDSGTLLIDGHSIETIPISRLRSSIGYVPQDTFLFSSTIKENIDFFLGESMENIEKASKLSKVYEDISEFPNKFDTVVGERGVTLSGGQKQRIAIARAIIREPAILILDDSLSAVDTHTEEEILRGLEELMKDRTSIIISHRISTIKDADEIILLEDGQIIERGTHETLLKKQGNYYNLYQKQLLAERLEEEE